MLNKYKGRVMALHVKDIGKLDADPHKADHRGAWARAPSTGRRSSAPRTPTACKHYFYEQEPPYTRPVLDSAKISADYLSKLTV